MPNPHLLSLLALCLALVLVVIFPDPTPSQTMAFALLLGLAAAGLMDYLISHRGVSARWRTIACSLTFFLAFTLTAIATLPEIRGLLVALFRPYTPRENNLSRKWAK